MAVIDKLITFFFKLIILTIGIVISIIPAIYLFANEPIHAQIWRGGMEKIQGRIEQVEQIRNHAFSNIYLREGDKNYGWADIDRTILLADYICWQLQKRGVVVIRKNLKFKEPKKGKKKSEENLQFAISSKIYQTPALHWLKQLLQEHIQFEAQSLQSKQYVIVNFDDLSVQTLAQIKEIKQSNEKYQFLIVTVVPISGKHSQVVPIRLSNVLQISAAPQISQKKIENKNDKKQGKKQIKKQQKAQNTDEKKKKSEKKYKVKKVKEEKQEKEEIAELTEIVPEVVPTQQPENKTEPSPTQL